MANSPNENQQFWPKYWVTNITNMSFVSFLLKNLQIRYKHCKLGLFRMQMKEYIPPHVHMHLCRPYVVTIRVGVPLWPRLLSATGPCKSNKNNTSGY